MTEIPRYEDLPSIHCEAMATLEEGRHFVGAFLAHLDEKGLCRRHLKTIRERCLGRGAGLLRIGAFGFEGKSGSSQATRWLTAVAGGRG